MAKSVRASVSKRNRANLRKKFFGPVVDARTERLSAKLQELASQPRPEKEGMDVESNEADQKDDDAKTAADEDMDIDTKATPARSQKKPQRVQKQRNRKPRNSIVFKAKSSGKDKKGSKRK
ncbi:uncharacterized protein N7469_005902 [Penicillium citrinum]|uniref:DUF2423 domain-containing protein n=2 Tax=Penicillium TaxID=5073 RepID=A0A9W9NX03_PENCI|nr:uncharacterized protein N7469_005902 [Penicillium citrinum]KAJ5231314.1 hypothetical protein N7469_005902 [Penicillium citrinum]KAJ5578848.1 hypothetical protein N7450_007715 [Penicillium hetheringtonii]